MEQLAGGGPVFLVGQSMGGHTAMLAAAWYPELVRGLVLLEAGVGGEGDEHSPAELGDWFASWPVPFPDLSAAFEFLGSSPIALSWAQDLEEHSDGLWPRFEPEIMQGAIAAVAEEARWDEWQRVKAPTALVCGQNGSLAAAEVQRMLASRHDVQHIVIPESGHDAHLEQPHAWVRVLEKCLNR
ncbi:hypothetical protein GCM10010201_18780 [Pilimelia columellifera subsp. columellifera]|uniref:AB hydrolase-1 domain-containing protein n=1 Tax=Pilimelia columellifera subsp. columellifera TaxID=706583 RepID=A0ABP6AR22_9ACTN